MNGTQKRTLAEETKAVLEEHLERCITQERAQFGEASKYSLTVTPNHSHEGRNETVGIVAGAVPIPEVQERCGLKRQHLGRTIERRFWLRMFEFRTDTETGEVSFFRQHEHRHERVASIGFDDSKFSSWMTDQVNVIARHVAGRRLDQASTPIGNA